MAGKESNESYESRLYDVAERLQIPDSTLQITRVRLDRLSGESEVDTAQLDRIAPAVLALSCREDGLPITDRDIVEPWVALLADPENSGLDPGHLPEQIEAVADRLDIDHPPERPDVLVGRYADALDMPDAVGTVAGRILRDTFQKAPKIVAEASSPGETAGAALVLAAEANGAEGFGPSDVADVSAAGGVTIKNRYNAFRDELGEEALNAERYQAAAVEATSDADAREPDAQPPATDVDADGESGDATATDGAETDTSDAAEANGDGEADSAVSAGECMDAVHEMFPDELPTTATVAEALDAPEEPVGNRLETLADDGELAARRAGETVAWIPGDREELDANLTIDAVQGEVDALAETLGVDASLRLFARGLVSDAVEDVPVEDGAEFAGAALVASSRLNDGDLDPATVATERDFEPRALYTWIGRLGETADVDIPQRGPSDVVESLAEDLALSDRVREESLRTLDHYRPEENGSFAPPELAAGAVFFAATTVREPIDVDELADSIGFETSHVSDAMNSVFVSLCRRLIRGEIDYGESPWTAELLESDHIAEIGDPHTGRVVAAAKTYIAGREDEHVDEGTLDVLLAED
ncbi:hypothetical protein [Halorhabdus amylolytica]|uniref:hypothetical protein n=1 Tax=Halorhabdus amylolytica TaxID=2559573 RepID=UPI0010AA05B6|nr:hypothetical protein [Halorhabdus amylolytica]